MAAVYIPDYESDHKYAGMRFDVIIPIYPATMDFMQTEGWALFPGALLQQGVIIGANVRR